MGDSNRDVQNAQGAVRIIKRTPVGGVGNFGRFFVVPQNVTTISFSGFGSRDDNQKPITGRITADNIAHGKKAAAGAALNFLCNFEEMLQKSNIDISNPEVGVLIALSVHINASPDVTALPAIADEACRMIDQFFEQKRNQSEFCKVNVTRHAVGHSTLPGGMSVEVSATVYIVMPDESKKQFTGPLTAKL
jgi:hypothetical protein